MSVGIIRWSLLWRARIGLRPEFRLRLRFRLGPGFRLSFRAGFGCRRFGCAFRNRLFSSYLDLFPPRALGLFHDGFSFSRACRRLDLRRSEEHTSELQSLMRISYAVFCLKKKKKPNNQPQNTETSHFKHKCT